MVIIQKFLKSIEVLFSVEYMIPLLIIDGVSNWPFFYYMSYICVLRHYRPSIEYIPHQHTSVWSLCIFTPIFTVSIPNWRSSSLARILIISRLFSIPHLCQMSATLLAGRCYSSCYNYQCRCYGTITPPPSFFSWDLVHFTPPLQ